MLGKHDGFSVLNVGINVGFVVGINVGFVVGMNVGSSVGAEVGDKLNEIIGNVKIISTEKKLDDMTAMSMIYIVCVFLKKA